jgi:hypothetical protein
MSAFFLLRMNDHLQYLNKIKATLDGKGDFQGSDHHSCKFGRWLDSDGPKEAAELGEDAKALFDGILEPHRQFHEASKAALELHKAGDQAQSAQKVTDMHRLSSDLVEKLLQLDRMSTRKKA